MMSAHRLHAARKRKREVYREKLILVIAAVLIAVFCCLTVTVKGVRFVQAQDTARSVAPVYTYYKSIEIEAGDTLWDLAQIYAEGSPFSVQDYIKELKAVNDLTDDVIHEGQYLTVIYYDQQYK